MSLKPILFAGIFGFAAIFIFIWLVEILSTLFFGTNELSDLDFILEASIISGVIAAAYVAFRQKMRESRR